MRSIFFIAMLFCAGTASLFVGFGAIYENIDFRLHGRQAMMELAYPDRKITIPDGGYDVHMVDVRYVSPIGSVVVPQRRLSGNVARTLASGGKVPVVYFTNNSERILYSSAELSNPWGWIIVGAVLLATFGYALKLRRHELQ